MSEPKSPAAALWEPPTVEGRLMRGRRPGVTIAELDAIERQAYEQGFASGREAGDRAGRQEFQAQIAEFNVKIAALDAVLGTLAQPLSQLDAEVEGELVSLALIIAKQLVRRELALEPAQVIGIVRHTVSLLPMAARDVRVHLHPEDAALVRERLAAAAGERNWQLIEDPLLARGGCRVIAGNSNIDARLESRLAAVTAELLGEQRSHRSTTANAP
jgi:flagellar assembly protein FliH